MKLFKSFLAFLAGSFAAIVYRVHSPQPAFLAIQPGGYGRFGKVFHYKTSDKPSDKPTKLGFVGLVGLFAYIEDRQDRQAWQHCQLLAMLAMFAYKFEHRQEIPWRRSWRCWRCSNYPLSKNAKDRQDRQDRPKRISWRPLNFPLKAAPIPTFCRPVFWI